MPWNSVSHYSKTFVWHVNIWVVVVLLKVLSIRSKRNLGQRLTVVPTSISRCMLASRLTQYMWLPPLIPLSPLPTLSFPAHALLFLQALIFLSPYTSAMHSFVLNLNPLLSLCPHPYSYDSVHSTSHAAVFLFLLLTILDSSGCTLPHICNKNIPFTCILWPCPNHMLLMSFIFTGSMRTKILFIPSPVSLGFQLSRKIPIRLTMLWS